MEENKMITKNMEYWKKKNNIPGIDTVHEAGLTGDGRASSSPFQQTEEAMEEEMKDPTEKIYIEGDYKEGDLINEDDFENQFKRTGEDPKDYPQLTVQDYSEVRVDEKGMYVQKLKEGEEIKGLEAIKGGVGETPVEMSGGLRHFTINERP